MSLPCFSMFPLVSKIPDGTLAFIRAGNFVVSSLNIIGNAFLIYALIVTGQTKAISIKFIVFLSISGLINGITGLCTISMLLWQQFEGNCFLTIVSQVTLGTTNPFSSATIVVIALDRYFHMKYLLRYPVIVNNRRGYRMIFACFCFALVLLLCQFLLIFISPEDIFMLQISFAILLVPLIGSVAGLYYKAYRNLQLKAPSQMSQVIKSALQECKKFAKTSKRIILSFALLASPLATGVGLRFVARYNSVIGRINLDAWLWMSLLCFNTISFSNSVIFIMHNRPVKELLKRLINVNRSNVSAIAET